MLPIFKHRLALCMAEAAYATSAGKAPALPQDYAIVGVISADAALLRGLAYAGRFGLIVSNGASAIVSLRGTQDGPEWIADFDFLHEPCDFPQGGVHRGFQRIYRALRTSILSSIKTSGCQQVLFAGHSLGAALALFAALDATETLTLTDPSVVSFAGPRAGHGDFAQYFDSRVPDCQRLCNRFDIVYHEPRRIWGYEHCGHEVALDSGGPLFDAHWRHSLAAYRAGLDALQGSSAPTGKLA